MAVCLCVLMVVSLCHCVLVFFVRVFYCLLFVFVFDGLSVCVCV